MTSHLTKDRLLRSLEFKMAVMVMDRMWELWDRYKAETQENSVIGYNLTKLCNCIVTDHLLNQAIRVPSIISLMVGDGSPLVYLVKT